MTEIDEKASPKDAPGGVKTKSVKVLIIDDEEKFRTSLSRRLSLRGFDVTDVGDGESGIRAVRRRRPEVVILDRKMPGMAGEEVLQEIKKIAPITQVIMLTGHASLESAAETGRLEAFAYLEKPCDNEELVKAIEDAAQERLYAMARHEIPRLDAPSIWGRLWGTHNFRPGIMILGALLFAGVYLMPTPASLQDLMTSRSTGDRGADLVGGYARYSEMQPGESIPDYYSRSAKRVVHERGADGQTTTRPLNAEEGAAKAKAMIGVLVVSALFWATGALPIGITALLVGALMYIFGVFSPNGVAQAYAKDSVIVILGVLALAAVVGKTGLDKRIGLVLLGTSKSITTFLFVFLPLLAVSASFLSEHALIAFIAPILMVVYMGAIKAANLKADKALVVLMMLGINYAANNGGPGSPAAGGRNAVMVGILADYGTPPTFGQWMMYGLPFVVVMSLVVGAYFYVTLARKVQVKKLDIAAMVRKEAQRLGPMSRQEWITLVVFAGVVVLWILGGEEGNVGLGMGGPVLLGLVVLAAVGIVAWRDISRISWEVVALYAAASAMGTGLAATGGAVWLARSFVGILPEFFTSGEGLCMAASFITGILTNFMSDGATVSAVGPITIPMATISGTHPWAVGLATAFASSFANALVVGTPNNAIAFSLAKDLRTGEQLLTLGDFLRHGVIVTLLGLAVLWGWTIFGYWRWIGFPEVAG